MFQKVRRLVLGERRDLDDPHVLHRASLVAFLAWVGLGADGLSSSAYGPEEAFSQLVGHGGDHAYLALPLAIAMGLTVLVIGACYTRVIERFPSGGGGYTVAKTLDPRLAVVSGSALLVDYVLTIATSVASCIHATFSLVPHGHERFALPLMLLALAGLVVLNLRGAKESVAVLAPIFVVFLVVHAVLVGGVLLASAPHASVIAQTSGDSFARDVETLGIGGLVLLVARAYSLGGGTYTGIEAVSNGLSIMREPRVRTAKRTMRYVAVSLALCAGGLLACYVLAGIRPESGKTMNAVLAETFARAATERGVPLGSWFVVTVLGTEAALLLVAAQSGFLDGPRVMANLAIDGWFPRRFTTLSDRLAMQDGVLLMGGAGAVLLLLTKGSVAALVTLYSINVFVTFTITELAMVRDALVRPEKAQRKRDLALHSVGLVLCATILAVTVHQKILDGGWLALVATGSVVACCVAVRRHYASVGRRLAALDAPVPALADDGREPLPFDPEAPTAVLLVRSYRGVGVASFRKIVETYPGFYRNVVFVSAAVVDAGAIQEGRLARGLAYDHARALEPYLALARAAGLAARIETAAGTCAIEAVIPIARRLARELARPHFFAGRIVFEDETLVSQWLHNDSGSSIARRLQLDGAVTVLLPVVLPRERRARRVETSPDDVRPVQEEVYPLAESLRR